MYIVVAIIAFGLMIAIHEFGHYIAAKALNVKVNEFAIGMGPKLFSIQGKETLYSLRLLPIGGFCSMEGEDGNNSSRSEDDEKDAAEIMVEGIYENTGYSDNRSRSFANQKRWRRIVILAAGGIANLIAAFFIVLILSAQAPAFVGTTLTDLVDGFPNEGPDGLMVGDRIVSLNGERMFYREDFVFFMQFAGGENVNLIIERDGRRIHLNDFPLYMREFVVDGQVQYRLGLTFNLIEPSLAERVRHSLITTMNYIRIVRVSLSHLISGAVGMGDVTGVVGIVHMMGEIGDAAPNPGIALSAIANFTALIMVNLAIINLLPIPALDGGRILFILMTAGIEKLTRRQLNPKYETYINSGALVLLIAFMVFIIFNDISNLIGSSNG